MSTHPSVRPPVPVEIPWEPVSVVPRVLVRLVGLLAVDATLQWLSARDMFGTDPVGIGIMIIALYPQVALVWGSVDGFRHRHRFGQVATAWLVAAPLAAVGMRLAQSAQVRAADPTYGLGQVGADLVESVPFMIGLLLVPALLAAGGVAAMSRRVR